MPCYRLGVSQNASSGGLGLSIARNMAQLDAATASLHNRPEGSFAARITIGRQNGNGRKDNS